MQPFNLVREGTTQVIAQACSRCGRVYQLGDSFVERCCDPRCSDCNASTAGRRSRCASCQAKYEAEREAAQIAKAKTVAEADYDGPIWYDGAWNDGYLRDLDEFREWWETRDDADATLPSSVWACTVRRLRLPRAADLVDTVCEDSYDGAYDDMPSTEELQRAIDAYNAQVTAEVWEVDFTCRVMLAARAAVPVPTPEAET